MKNLVKLLSYFKSYRLWTFLGSFLVFAEVIMELFLPSIMANIINIGINNHDTSYIVTHVIIMFFLTIIGILGGIFSTYYTAKTTSFMSADMRRDVMNKITHLSFSHLDQLKVGNIVTILTDDIMTIGNIFMMGIRILLRVPIILFGSLIMAILISPKLSLLLLFLIPIVSGIILAVMKKAIPYFDQTQVLTDSINAFVHENVYGIKTIKSFCKESSMIERFERLNGNLRKVNLKALHMMTFVMPTVMFFINLAIILVLWGGGVQVYHNQLPIGDILAFIQYLTNILSAVMIVSMMMVMVSKSEVSANRIRSILNLPERQWLGTDKTPIMGSICFDHVTFSYGKGGGDEVLKDLSFSINQGEFVAIVGGTGSGKSTLISLLCGFYTCNKGTIYLDKKEITTYDRKGLQEQMVMCPQYPWLCSGTILDNLEMGKNYEIESINDALKLACANQFVERKPHGIYSQVEQLGTNFSGGEKQRLSLARTLLRDANVIILDNATSAIDLKTEQMILKNIHNLKEKTIIWISNRTATIKNADKIIVLEDGKIEAIGTHDDLLNSSKSYHDLYVSQQMGGVQNAR